MIEHPAASLVYALVEEPPSLRDEPVVGRLSGELYKGAMRDDEGKFYRKGVSGSWREDLTGKQVEIVESITAPLLEEFYPEQGVGSSRA